MSKVLLVEDDVWLAELECAVLRDAGHEVRTAPNALEAIEMIDAELPEVLVLDVLLAGTTAFALLHELQSYGDTGGIPIVLCTNIAEQLDATKLEHYGVKRVVDKTTATPDDIAAAVKAALL